MQKIFSVTFLVLLVIFSLGFWYFLQNLSQDFGSANLIFLFLNFTFIVALAMLIFVVNFPKYVVWISFFILPASFLTVHGLKPIYLVFVAAAILFFLNSFRQIKKKLNRNLKFSFWSITISGVKSFVIGILILYSVLFFALSSNAAVRYLGFSPGGIKWSFKIVQNIVGDKYPYLSPDLNVQQLVFLYMLEQVNSKGMSLSQLNTSLSPEIRNKLNAAHVSLLDFVRKKDFVAGHQELLNSLIASLEKDSFFRQQEQEALRNLGLGYSDAKTPISELLSQVVSSKIKEIWPDYGIWITIFLAISLVLFLALFRFWLALPGILLGMFLFWILKKRKVIKLAVQKVDREEVQWL